MARTWIGANLQQCKFAFPRIRFGGRAAVSQREDWRQVRRLPLIELLLTSLLTSVFRLCVIPCIVESLREIPPCHQAETQARTSPRSME